MLHYLRVFGTLAVAGFVDVLVAQAANQTVPTFNEATLISLGTLLVSTTAAFVTVRGIAGQTRKDHDALEKKYDDHLKEIDTYRERQRNDRREEIRELKALIAGVGETASKLAETHARVDAEEFVRLRDRQHEYESYQQMILGNIQIIAVAAGIELPRDWAIPKRGA